MAGLNPPQAPLHFEAVFQPAVLASFRQTLQGVFHASREAVPDGFLFFLPAAGAAQDISLLALGNGYLLHFHFGPHLSPIVLQQLFFKLLHLAARCSHQVLAAALADRRQVLLAHDAAIEYPDPPRLAIFAFHHAQHRFHARHVSTVAIERLIAEREPFAVDDQRDHHLLAVGTMIARVAPAHHRIL